MIYIEAHFNFNRILLLALGLWPYQQTKLDRFRLIFFLSILMTAILFQFTIFLTSKCTPDLIIKVLSNALFFTSFVIEYICFAINTEVVKDLLTQLQYIYNEIKDKNENAIIEKYGYNAKRHTAVLTIFAVCSISGLIVAQFWSNILDIVLPINVSRTRHTQFITEYFVDQERYFFFILLHINVAFCIGVVVAIAIGTLLIAYLQHTCGMFRIARLSKLLVYKFETMLFCLIVAGVITLSLSLFRITSYGIDVTEFLLPSLFITVSILCMFLANNTAQDVMNHNNDVFTTIYNVQWYTTPLHIQRLILFLLQRGTKDFTLNVGGLFIGSLECFATLVKASVSYFTVIYSMR